MAWPFELFLFSYIVIGPLHYLTEINWLDKQNYFLRENDRRIFIWSVVVLVLLITVTVFVADSNAWHLTKPLYDAIVGPKGDSSRDVMTWSWVLSLLAFVMAGTWLFTEYWTIRLTMVVICLVTSVLFYTNFSLAVLFGIVLPTIGHVFFFTILFMLYGTLKGNSLWGYLNIASMFLAVAVIAICPRHVVPGSLSHSVSELNAASAFNNVDYIIIKWLGLSGQTRPDMYSPLFFKVQSFIAFAYTYHYLNWFSKTSIIKWHQVKKEKFVYSGILWLVSLAFYKIDFRLGFAAVTVLSELHVVLEFPLNFVSMRAITRVLIDVINPPRYPRKKRPSWANPTG